MSEILKVLSRIQQDLKAPKGQFNSFSNYNYRSCEDILSAVKPLLDGATITLSDEMVEVGGRVYVKATAMLHSGGDNFSVTAFARESDQRKGMNSDQLTGATSSYARKYALNGMFAIDDTKDSDTTDHRKSGAKQPVKSNTPAPKAKPVDLTKAVSDFMKLSQPDRDKAWDTLPPALCTAINKAYANGS